MLPPALFIIAALALGSASLAAVELMTVSTRTGGTVFQQISARVDLGLSLLVFVTAAGLGGILRRMDRNNDTRPSPEAVAAAERRNRKLGADV